METLIVENEISVSVVAIYATVSFLIVSLCGAFLYISCSKKYRLNWFEKSILEAAKESDDLSQCNEVLIGASSAYNADNVSESSRSLYKDGNITPTSINSNQSRFWFMQQGMPMSSTEESLPPSSPTDSTRSMALSINSIPIAKNDKSMILAMNLPRPKVTSMHAKLDHTKIDTSLYLNKSMNQAPIKPQKSEDIRGNIHMNIHYDPVGGHLTVRLIEAQDLQPRDFSGTADPYAKVRLLPDKKNIWQTRIHKKTLNPIFDEDFVFEEHSSMIERRTIEILLYDFDSYSRHLCIGGTEIQLDKLDLSNKVDLWTPLGPCSEQDAKIDLGDIMVSLSYLQSAARLTVIIMKARNLRVVDDTRNSSDPYVKVTLIHGGKKLKKRKTTVVRNTVSPVYNEALTFDVPKEILKNSYLEFVVVHDSLLGSNEVLGRALLGHSQKIGQEERSFFDEIFRSKTAIAQWIPLQEKTMNVYGHSK